MADDRVFALWSDAMCGMLRKRVACYRRPWWIEEEDIYQEMCLLIHRVAGDRGMTEFTAKFLRFVVDNQFRKILRKRWREKRRVAGTGVEPPARCGFPLDGRLDVREAVGSQPRKTRSILALKFDRGMSTADIASETGETRGVVEWRLKVAYLELRDALAEGYGPAEDRTAPSHRRPRNRRLKRRRQGGAKGTDWSQWGPIPNQRDDD